MKTMYMHTLEDRPAEYYPGQQICFASRARPIRLAKDLKQIKREKKASDKWRSDLDYNLKITHGWMRVVVEYTEENSQKRQDRRCV